MVAISTRLGRAELVPDEREHVDAHRVHVHRQLADALRRVHVHEHARPRALARRGDLGDRLHRAHLWVVLQQARSVRASQWRCGGAFFSCFLRRTSLFECITVTRSVRGVTAAATALASTRPSRSTGTYVTSSRPAALSASRHSVTAGCSTLDVTTCGRLPPADAGPSRRRRASSSSMTPRMAWLSASEPQPVKMISSGFAPISCATAALALFTAAAHDRPKACPLDGLPQWSCRNGIAASATSGHTGLVAW